MLKKTVSSLIVLGICCTPLMALAQHDDYHDTHQQDTHQQDAHHQQYVHHNDWKKGYHMRSEDWNRGERVEDYRSYHLSAPPRGYEWREVDGNYVLGAVTTGIVASVVIASATH